MNLREFSDNLLPFYLILHLYFVLSYSLKCKCTQSSGKVKCTDGVCEMNFEPAGKRINFL